MAIREIFSKLNLINSHINAAVIPLMVCSLVYA